MQNFRQRLFQFQLTTQDRIRLMFFISLFQVLFSLTVMIILGVVPLILSGIIGILLLLITPFFHEEKKIPYLLMMLLSYSFISILMSAYFIDLDFGFHHYLVLMIPFSFVFSYNITRFRYSIMIAFVAFLLTIITYILCLLLNIWGSNIITADIVFISFVRSFNHFIIVSVLFIFVSMFIFRLESNRKETHALLQKLEFDANHDALTGLFNRRFMDHVFHQVVNQNEPFVIVLGDIDSFKRINDTYGHLAGDEVIKRVASIIQSEISPTDYCARWGGEEYLILIQSASANAVQQWLQELQIRIKDSPITFQNQTISIQISFGFQIHDHAQSIDDTIRIADHYLYKMKEARKHQK